LLLKHVLISKNLIGTNMCESLARNQSQLGLGGLATRYKTLITE
jgi:hypothetical protein